MTDPALLTDEELITLHRDLMEDPCEVYYWRELDEQLQYRHEEEGLPWPY